MKKFLILLGVLFITGLNVSSQNVNTDSLIKLIRNDKIPDSVKCSAITTLAWEYRYQKADTALILANQELKLLGNENNEMVVKAYAIIGHAYFSKSDYKLALENFLTSLKFAEETKNKSLIAFSYSQLGTFYLYQDLFPEALNCYSKALKLNTTLNDKFAIADNYLDMRDFYGRQADYPKQLEFSFKAMEIFKTLSYKRGLAGCYNGIGIIYINQKKYKEAEHSILSGLAIYKELNNKNMMSACYNNLSVVYINLLNYSKAIHSFLQAIGIAKELKNDFELPTYYRNISKYYKVQLNYKLALLYADSSLQTSKTNKDLQSEQLAYEALADLYLVQGNYKESLRYYHKFKYLTDSIFNLENSKQLGDLKTQFEIDKKEAEYRIKSEAQQLIANKEKRQNQTVIAFILVVLFVVIIFSVLLYRRFRVTTAQKKIIELKESETRKQKALIEEKHKEITDSINYAERIQRSFMATKTLLDNHLKNYFVFFQPKDIVSGDFYWASQLNNGNFGLVTADSTGHGVPGAIMSILNISSLEKSAENSSEPKEILNSTRKIIIERLLNDGSEQGGKDGMDCSFVSLDFKNSTLTYAAANNPIWIVRKNNLIELLPDNMPVGKHDKDSISFTQHLINLEKGDMIYALTDGYPDQFGGPKGKKFMYKKLKELLVSISGLGTELQEKKLSETLTEWKGNLEQVDDICIIGIRV